MMEFSQGRTSGDQNHAGIYMCFYYNGAWVKFSLFLFR